MRKNETWDMMNAALERAFAVEKGLVPTIDEAMSLVEMALRRAPMVAHVFLAEAAKRLGEAAEVAKDADLRATLKVARALVGNLHDPNCALCEIGEEPGHEH